ncbi:hypothetical protein [Paenisporosarcina cavernae]|uniref:Uncharacterized protein n=1 Tax=Paenisporosarcina cavernae TaxID=2320858 RepID=A0A385YQT3_9BACL|nr:hypothetical protein [Paenisporosarcina cavernae]AYC28750.1 hypothetical protein D3873_02265 [Paenisporosarcina cavernae]
MSDIIYWCGDITYAHERRQSFEQLLQKVTCEKFQPTSTSRATTLEELKKAKADLLIMDNVTLDRFNRKELATCARSVLELDCSPNHEVLPDNYDCFSTFALSPFASDRPFGWDFFLAPIHLDVPSTSHHPKVVVHFGDEDRHNLSYRVLRHLVQLAIPLEVVVCLTPDYKGDITSLKLLALGKSSATVKEVKHPYAEIASSTIVIGDGSYGAFISAYLKKAYIALSQTDAEFDQMLELEMYGISHLGLGRKVKQSHLQNALMELYLHPKKAQKQVELQERWKEKRSGEDFVTFATRRLSVLQ